MHKQNLYDAIPHVIETRNHIALRRSLQIKAPFRQLADDPTFTGNRVGNRTGRELRTHFSLPVLQDNINKGAKMKQRESKDVTQKNLESYPDVAADILNVFIHEGKQEVQAEFLLPAPTETEYAAPGCALQNQLEDISKYGMRNLPPATRELFRSDMRHVVDYLAEGNSFRSDRPVIHKEALVRLLRALGGDVNVEDTTQILEQMSFIPKKE